MVSMFISSVEDVDLISGLVTQDYTIGLFW